MLHAGIVPAIPFTFTTHTLDDGIRQFSPRKQEAKNQVILIYEEKVMKSLLTTREKEKLIEEFEISRKSYATFSRKNGITPHTFTTWVYKWRKAKEKNRS